SRMVQGLFDDRNPETRDLWRYPDTGQWDPERNVREFLAAMPVWREKGLLAVTLNLQGGSPQGYSKEQPWHNSAFEEDGALRTYKHEILQPPRIHELIERVRRVSEGGLLVGTSYGGGSIPHESVVRASDFLLLHGNGVSDPQRIAQMVRETRSVPGYRPMPVLFNEDDH